jgi:hypothetical protein
MRLTALDHLRLRRLARVVGAACIAVPIFNLTTDEVSVGAALQGLIDAVLVSSVVVSHDLSPLPDGFSQEHSPLDGVIFSAPFPPA